MRSMSNFIPVKLPSDPANPDYRKAVKALRDWAGPHVNFGLVDMFQSGQDGELLLREAVVDRICALHLVPSEIYGSTVAYIAEPQAPTRANEGVIEAIRINMRIDRGPTIWVIGVAVVEQAENEGAAWRFQLTPKARELAIASFLESNGVDPGVDVSALADALECDGD